MGIRWAYWSLLMGLQRPLLPVRGLRVSWGQVPCLQRLEAVASWLVPTRLVSPTLALPLIAPQV